MAIIQCSECAHQVSDRAASCPSCGAPVTPTVKTKRRHRRVIPVVLLAVMTLWTLGTLTWLLVPGTSQQKLIALGKSSLQGLDRRIEPSRPPGQLRATYQVPAPQQRAGAADRLRKASPPPSQPEPLPRSVYQTTAEQLYHDYNANVVAVRTKIGASRVRVRGSVTEIDQDVTEHPVVRLWSSKDSSIAMTLTDDERAAAAQLAKGETVEIECDKVGRGGTSLLGSDCNLAFVDASPQQVSLALFLANDNGAARVYVVGPMSEAACLDRSDGISSRLNLKQRGEHVVSKNCTTAAQETIAPADCRLNSTPVTLPDIPTAHLWRYDCGPATVTRTSARKTAARASQPVPPVPVDEATAVEVTPPEQSAAATGPPAPRNIHLASAGESDTGTTTGASQVPVEEATVAHAPGTTAPAEDDLAQVRAVDPRAADHIATYCSKTIVSADRDTLTAECRRRETEAWTRLVLQKEFPELDEATRRKCSEPPFPDTYVAKEACARYELHLN